MHDTMYRLTDSVNEVTWYQIGDQGTELFYLPSHPALDTDCAALARPGWRYAGYFVRGFDDYLERLEAKGAAPRVARAPGGRCALVRDPDGAALLFFEDNTDAPLSVFDFTDGLGAVTGIAEAGLVAARPQVYNAYFQAVGLQEQPEAQSADFLGELFQYSGRIESCVYGHIRVLHLPDETFPDPRPMFPEPAQEHLDYYPDLGLKHICYYVDDIGAFHEAAAARGVYFLFAPVRISGGARMAYFSDPEGHVIEVMQVPPALRRLAALGGAMRQAQMDLFSFVKRRIG